MRNEEKNGKLRYGSRKASKLVRCYYKDKLGVYRVEVELHASLLRQNDISTLDDFIYLPDVICPRHLLFVDVDWKRLGQYLSNNLDEGQQISVEARRSAASLRRVRRYLKKKGVVNFHRFLVPMPVNEEVGRALKRWAHHFKKEAL
jgi:hypothetical protein